MRDSENLQFLCVCNIHIIAVFYPKPQLGCTAQRLLRYSAKVGQLPFAERLRANERVLLLVVMDDCVAPIKAY